ncbi:MAG: hypothetical protein ACYC7E_22985 [Armatimonadota bacterium]
MSSSRATSAPTLQETREARKQRLINEYLALREAQQRGRKIDQQRYALEGKPDPQDPSNSVPKKRRPWNLAQPSQEYGQKVLDYFDQIRQRLYHPQPKTPTTSNYPPGMPPQFTNPTAPGYVDPNSPEGRVYAQRQPGIGR